MKTKSFMLQAFTILGFSCTLTAQSVTCSDFSITGLSPDTLNPNGYNFSIQFSAPSDNFINYPHVSAVLDCAGDTVATGGPIFFGQLGQTTNDYPVTVSGSLACQPLTAVFVYGDESLDNDTCLLSFGTTGVLTDIMDAISFYPNPVESQVTIQSDLKLNGSHFEIYDNTGKLILTRKLDSENTTIDMSFLSRGIYLFRVGENVKQTFKVVKE